MFNNATKLFYVSVRNSIYEKQRTSVRAEIESIESQLGFPGTQSLHSLIARKSPTFVSESRSLVFSNAMSIILVRLWFFESMCIETDFPQQKEKKKFSNNSHWFSFPITKLFKISQGNHRNSVIICNSAKTKKPNK